MSGNQKYCAECGRDPEKARRRYAAAVAANKRHAGEADKPVEKVCKNCGKTFLTVYRGKDFCTSSCGEAYRINHAECPICHTRLIEKGITTGKGYCSEACREEARLQRAIQDGDYIACEQCGKKFIRKNFANRFCSKECYEAYREAAKVPAKEPGKKPGLAKKVCPVCKKEFTVSPLQMSKRYCSVECRNRALSAPKPAAAKPGTHLCTTCRVSQKACERFSSGFKKLPEGAELRKVNGQDAVVACPKYR